MNVPACLKLAGVKGIDSPVRLPCVGAAQVKGGLQRLSPGLVPWFCRQASCSLLRSPGSINPR